MTTITTHPRIGQLCRNGVTIFYVSLGGQFIIEFATFADARRYLAGERTVTI